MCVSVPLHIPDIYKNKNIDIGRHVCCYGQTNVRACGQCQSNELHLFVTSYMGKLVITADRKVRDFVKRKCTCKHRRFRSAACRTPNSALKWIKQNIRGTMDVMNSRIRREHGRTSCQETNPTQPSSLEERSDAVKATPSARRKQTCNHETEHKVGQQSRQFTGDGPTPQTSTPSSN